MLTVCPLLLLGVVAAKPTLPETSPETPPTPTVPTLLTRSQPLPALSAHVTSLSPSDQSPPTARSPEQSPDWRERVLQLAKAHRGQVAMAIRHLRSGEALYWNADKVMPTASLIKVAVMAEAYCQAAAGQLDLQKTVTLRDSDKVPGSGILTPHFSDGATFSLRDAVRLMIVFSDNTATNLVLRQVGIGNVNRRMEQLRLPNTRIYAEVYRGSTTSIDPERTKKYGLGSTTAREMVQLLEYLHEGKVASPQACAAMREHMKNCDDRGNLARFAPAGMELAFKTGAVSHARTAAGIAYTRSGPVIICVLTANNHDQRWSRDNAAELLIAEIAQTVFDQFHSERPAK